MGELASLVPNPGFLRILGRAVEAIAATILELDELPDLEEETRVGPLRWRGVMSRLRSVGGFGLSKGEGEGGCIDVEDCCPFSAVPFPRCARALLGRGGGGGREDRSRG